MSSDASTKLSLEETFLAERYCALLSKDSRQLIYGPPTSYRTTWTKGSRLAKAEDYLQYAAGLLQIHGFHFPVDDLKKFEVEYERLTKLAPAMNASFDPLGSKTRDYKNECRELFICIGEKVTDVVLEVLVPIVSSDPPPPY
ncbi:hypothetical protein PUNSTDRAFT_143912 [Punctularia strigosozonata HHB-11173 SS5]|uniref:uncharacterized protein n=1 Tax=Punctularia strigosozonata (strain HHB-11173) TaxID=741275 RepID=UPI0004417E79|nr:uncharacterized protein PUNSTDRAFT_143912 [Punctularia strigosozonata HHB-11173 SS5]EIN08275.1 hypothetical protein PUNSTDRAFT_143912 [Punctularia strigosozonata HHB-11173 SS5]